MVRFGSVWLGKLLCMDCMVHGKTARKPSPTQSTLAEGYSSSWAWLDKADVDVENDKAKLTVRYNYDSFFFNITSGVCMYFGCLSCQPSQLPSRSVLILKLEPEPVLVLKIEPPFLPALQAKFCRFNSSVDLSVLLPSARSSPLLATPSPTATLLRYGRLGRASPRHDGLLCCSGFWRRRTDVVVWLWHETALLLL